MAKTTPGQFVRQVRQEMAKVTWPTRKEATMALIMVFIFSAVLGLYFMLLDRILSFGMSLLFG